jgi:L-threonylcarbamoyladenylate synthase
VAAPLDAAVDALRAGGVIAYPTEAVYGLGCDPANQAAVARLFELKERPPTQGVLLIAATFEQAAPYFELAAVPPEALARARADWPGPYTWVFPRAAHVPGWLTGAHAGIALRVTAHPLAAELCLKFGAPIVSTSANRHGDPPARSAAAVRTAFGDGLAYILDGELGGLERPTPIRDVLSGALLRT